MCFIWEGLNLLLVLGFFCWILCCEKNLKSCMFHLGGLKSFVSFRIFLAGYFFVKKILKSCVFCLGGVISFVSFRDFLVDILCLYTIMLVLQYFGLSRL